ncbi:4-hydroxy-3-methylbut-2-enyl diphosphate reductase [Pseudomonas gingeri]|uniref:4-hydroxy-3-methylbut-2-enyl diphosphate reductase n=1 Tax=Pseudomonas gingeri TaxID=117681 RepID=UPI0015A44805|nr:4-hydroxy-3-methylbut-2-enyl diphosphate reductase [Pseudomonas gingeri]NWA04193.1 4-hydroxy-3-methylbut-2-enyl diphosphate reductase [Pseudomonas gingeri]NWA17539.1 4-hydroxy-3-methylbut-2-enyl diphosphate reductase [Pseudomonas gingeri]NWA56500.1 4-hydroxy-3-methylbut-2-enyl diphosphate reductase [Pseudomonas gingeri]NWA97810.1 4-hydroxy-3-methylbut-2-enyl diphosphate reductase [Pseudomonas gingeri]NWB05349.1 4-hydroxy-3-methylbut-2-enyl diphosphate reductase [Pseudomonas gingeri]
MNVILAQPRGFCAGVVRAIDIVELALEQYGVPVYVRHEIVHNRHVVDSLKAQGAIFVDELDEVPIEAIAVFSAHGVARVVEDAARQRQLRVLDATCPLVAKVHNQGRQYAAKGYQVVLIGDVGHPEVIGILGQVPAPVVVVRDVEQVQALPFAPDTPLAYITQTTLSVDDTRVVVLALQRRYPGIVGPDTRDICYAVQNRQNALRSLSQCVDLMLVVGAANSANTVTLHTLADETGVPAYRVADGSELDRQWFRDIETVGITAGASTPEALVEDVIAALGKLAPLTITTLPGREERVQFNLPDGLIARSR